MSVLNNRKMKILEAIINDYIATAEPIGSRTIAKKYDFGISSATIRNEMSDLEEMGYVAAPHASAGRIPSDKGYRLYVDEVMKKRRLSQQERDVLAAIWGGGEPAFGIMREVARAMSAITNYTIIATEPPDNAHKIKMVQVFVVDGPLVALVVVTDKNVARTQVVMLPHEISLSATSKISMQLTALLAGSTVHDITNLYIAMARHRFVEIGLDDACVEPLLKAIVEALYVTDPSEIYTVGIKNILDFPEFADLEKARTIMSALEEKDELLNLLDQNCDAVKITIGDENENALLKECSVIKTRVTAGSQSFGSIAIIGPTRMDYAQVISVLQAVFSEIKGE